MNGSGDSHLHMEPPLEIDRVEWLSASPQAVLVRVLGHWRGPVSDVEPVLLVDEGGGRRPFERMPGEPGQGPGGDPGAWVAHFSVPIELRPRLEHGLALKFGARELALPGAVAGSAPVGGPPVAGEVIDRAVLAERRARRAEVNEQALARRIAEADARVTTLESQLANLEQRLEQTTRERERMAGEIAEREGDVRRVKQREYAEQQLRVEAEERRDRSERRARAQLEDLHRRLAEAEREAVGLAEELESARRELAEAQHAAAAERAGVRRARAELAEREVEITRREAALAEAEQNVSGGLAAASAAETDLAALRQELETERATLGGRLGALESRANALQGELEREQAGRQQAEQDLATARARLAAGAQTAASPEASALESSAVVEAAEKVARLEAEVERRTRLHDQVQAELAALHEELERLRESAVAQTERDRAAERLLAGLTETIGGLRTELKGVEQRQHELEGEAARMRHELAEREEEMLRLGAGAGRDAAELARLREQTSRHAEQRSEREAELERMVRELMDTASELREGFERELASLNAEMQERVLAEREVYQRELAAMEQRVEGLRRDLLDTAARLRTELEAERASRHRAEMELARARERADAEPAAPEDLPPAVTDAAPAPAVPEETDASAAPEKTEAPATPEEPDAPAVSEEPDAPSEPGEADPLPEAEHGDHQDAPLVPVPLHDAEDRPPPRPRVGRPRRVEQALEPPEQEAGDAALVEDLEVAAEPALAGVDQRRLDDLRDQLGRPESPGLLVEVGGGGVEVAGGEPVDQPGDRRPLARGRPRGGRRRRAGRPSPRRPARRSAAPGTSARRSGGAGGPGRRRSGGAPTATAAAPGTRSAAPRPEAAWQLTPLSFETAAMEYSDGREAFDTRPPPTRPGAVASLGTGLVT